MFSLFVLKKIDLNRTLFFKGWENAVEGEKIALAFRLHCQT